LTWTQGSSLSSQRGVMPSHSGTVLVLVARFWAAAVDRGMTDTHLRGKEATTRETAPGGGGPRLLLVWYAGCRRLQVRSRLAREFVVAQNRDGLSTWVGPHLAPELPLFWETFAHPLARYRVAHGSMTTCHPLARGGTCPG